MNTNIKEIIEKLDKYITPVNKTIIIVREELPTTNSTGLVLQQNRVSVKSVIGTVVSTDDDRVEVGKSVIIGSTCGIELQIKDVATTVILMDDIIGLIND